MILSDIIWALEQFAPKDYQEAYDNSGLQIGNRKANISRALVTLDVTEQVVEEAILKGANLIISHHPLIFSGLKSLTGRNYVERTVMLALRNDIHIYSAHTNLDNVSNGVNALIAEKLGLRDLKILSPKTGTLLKLVTYIPENHADDVRDALFNAGAGKIGNYQECSFSTNGTGSFRPGIDAAPAIGEAGGRREWVKEVKTEVLVPAHCKHNVMQALLKAHPYEEVAYEWVQILNTNQEIGAGAIGLLQKPLSPAEFLELIKNEMRTKCIRHTAIPEKPIRSVALCGGSGSSLLPNAITAGADAFVTADYKYHQFFDAENKIMIADIGHYESEQFTPEIFKKILKEKFPNFAVLLSDTLTNPVNYYC